ncbi:MULTISPECIES: sulfatase-like hydrolase/transferase [Pseudomonas aeruginosa group]|uniref:sulfatase-like hydrolase/transferase n=1 Tax=Pseudomonas aeruginosa group TaxID=136841 RepID=UPI00071C08DF|nr:MULTISPECIES: sulfatase-like hydrolase/transferase [Pseudomonas aeruginosa group]KSC43574.1 sulfatase [Pseudomonas paraeruginosa]KSL19599.1 sulfatase [Pseudomonas aeruginosa]MBH8711664.1 sulfatase-like hydrolase/transferase [Pseudomonas aeruginosa]MBH9340644.1 sulfatase-like hydrolase/transferase [Pseudomonas aeruginosa]MBI8114408.1 sulfatase-like hydrolase/transferase [Pseudomonas aeruginosa]
MPQIDRRRLLQWGSMFLASSLTGVSLASTSRRQSRPNILWLVSEDNCPFIGAYGDPLARTPTLDRLAHEGILYRNVYSNAPVCAPSRFGILTGVYAESCAPANHMRARARLPDVLKTYPQYLREAGYYCSNNAKTDYNCDVDPSAIWDECSGSAHWRSRPRDTPFMAVFNHETTHESRIFFDRGGAVRPQDIRVPAYLPDTPAIRQDFASYYNLMERLDGQIAERLAELEEDGLAEDTIVFYYSDNGGVLPRSKRYCYEEGLRCALIVRVPKKWAHLVDMPAGSQVDTPVTFIDLAPSVLALAGLPAPAQMQGSALFAVAEPRTQRHAFGMRNRMDERYDFVRTVSDTRYRYIRNYLPHRICGQYQAFGWMAGGYRDWLRLFQEGRLSPQQAAFFCERPHEELYDLRQDPDEVANLADSPAHREKLEELRGVLDRHMLQINDNGFIPEGSPLEGYLESRKPGAYPLQRIMRLAVIAARRDPASLDVLIASLDDENEVIRFWAASGLLMLREQAAPARERLLKTLHEDTSQTRIVAAEALVHLHEEGPAIALLAGYLDPGRDKPLRLQAINALTYCGAPARAVLPALKTCAEDDDQDVRSSSEYLVRVLEGRFDPEKPVFDLWFFLRQRVVEAIRARLG